MKKRITTLLVLGMLAGGISSTLSAQNLDGITLVRGYDNGVYEKKDLADSPLSVTTLYVTLSNFASAGKTTTVYFAYNETAEYLGLPASYTFERLDTITLAPSKTFAIKVNKNWDMPLSVNGSVGIIKASLDKGFPAVGTVVDADKYYNYPTFTVEYMPTTANYSGLLRVSGITGSHPDYNKYMERSLKKDKVYSYFTYDDVLVPFSEIEVANLAYGDKILVTTAWETYTLNIPGLKDEQDPGTITRPVKIPPVSDAILNVETGVIMVPSTEDFSFTIKPTGSNIGLKPVVETDRKTIPDSEGVTYKELSDGSWLVTIVRVQSAINLTISFTDDVSNASIESNSVWANGGQLYVNAVTSSKVSIYSITGALVKTATISAGETANISLPTGFYVVTVNGKVYKVTVR